ncbi:MAG: S24 family peptidase [Flavobacteriaceae bacterium]|nr:S24 family peptidase [Flavobacteriaceae bacterium]
MSKVVEKLEQFLSVKNIKVSAAESMIGVGNGTLQKPFKGGKEIKTDTLEKFLLFFDDLNPGWLFNENAELDQMFIKNMQVNDPESVKQEKSYFETGKTPFSVNEPRVFKLRTDANYDDQAIPLYSLEAAAGLVELFQEHNDIQPIDTIHIPNLPKCDGAVFVAGDSMYPLLKSGDIVMYKQVHDIKNDIFWGQMYLVSLASNGDEYVMVKYIQRSPKGDDYVTLVSENRHHQDKDIKISKIRALALIKGSVRINTMN